MRDDQVPVGAAAAAGATAARRRAVAIWSVCALAALAAGFAVGPLGPRAERLPVSLGATAGIAAVALLIGCLAVLLLIRRPSNPIGLLFVGLATMLSLSILLDSYAKASFATGAPPLPGAVAVGWVNLWTPFVLWLLITFVLLLFPTGTLVSPRWRPVARVAVGVHALAALGAMVSPSALADVGPVNPLAVPAAEPVTTAVGDLSWMASTLLLVLSAASLVVRYRSGRGVERQQLKWLALSGVFVFAGGMVLALGAPLGYIDAPLGSLGALLFAGGLITVPVFATVAILRYRLYAIDRLISRTLSYALLMGLLAVLYASSVFVLSAVVASTGGGSRVAVAAATLAVAAAFRPLRRRVETVVNHRFDRVRYDAEQTVRAFAERLRDRVDVDDVREDLLHTAVDVVHPSRAIVWLR